MYSGDMRPEPIAMFPIIVSGITGFPLRVIAGGWALMRINLYLPSFIFRR